MFLGYIDDSGDFDDCEWWERRGTIATTSLVLDQFILLHK